MYDQLDKRGVPASRGVPVIVQIAAILGIIAIFAIGASVILSSGWGHHWPSTKTLRIDLTGHNG